MSNGTKTNINYNEVQMLVATTLHIMNYIGQMLSISRHKCMHVALIN